MAMSFCEVGEPDADLDARPSGARPEVEQGDVRLRVLLVEDGDRLDVIGGAHRALDGDGQGDGIAVLDQRRDLELDAAVADRGFARELPDRRLHRLRHGGAGGPDRHRRQAAGGRERRPRPRGGRVDWVCGGARGSSSRLYSLSVVR